MRKESLHVIFTKGIQASGKSTWACEFVKNHQDYKRINRDSFRFMLSDYTFDDRNEKLVTKLEDDATYRLIDEGYNLVLDNMHLNKKSLDTKIRDIKQYCEQIPIDFLYEIKEFPITLGEAVIRDAKRERPVGKNVIKSTWQKYEIELKQMIERAKPKVEIDNKLPWCVLCDIDGTLSNSSQRRIFDETSAYNDLVIEQVKIILQSVSNNNRSNGSKVCPYIFIVSGRKDSCYGLTYDWISDSGIPCKNLFMRKAEDNRKDTIVKSEIYEEHIKGKYNVLAVFDDRPSVIDMWTKKGLFVFNCNQDPYAKNDF
jgi:predicted kinase